MGGYVKRSSEPTYKIQPGFNWIIRRFRSKRCADTKIREKHQLNGQLNGCVGFCTFRQFAYFRYLISDAHLHFLRFHPWFDRLNFTCVIHLLSNPYDNNNVINERNNNAVLPRGRFPPIWNLMKILPPLKFFSPGPNIRAQLHERPLRDKVYHLLTVWKLQISRRLRFTNQPKLKTLYYQGMLSTPR